MECLYCGYKDDQFENGNWVEPKNGQFYKLPIELTRPGNNLWGYNDKKELFACPKCKKLFID